MATDKEAHEGTVENIKDVLVDKDGDHSAKLRALQNLKNLFTSPDQIFSKLKLDSLLQGARISLENKKPGKDFLYRYGVSLVGFSGKDETLDSELFSQLEYILRELEKEDEDLTDSLIADLWKRFEDGSFFRLDGIFDISKRAIEKAVLDWVEDPTKPQLDLLSKTSVSSPKMFQTLTSILYGVLAGVLGHPKMFELTESFLTSARLACKNEGKDFLGLYPEGCSRLVALLKVSPEVYLKENEKVFDEILSLLLEMFLTDRKKVLILLSHYAKWVSYFKKYVHDNTTL